MTIIGVYETVAQATEAWLRTERKPGEGREIVFMRGITETGRVCTCRALVTT